MHDFWIFVRANLATLESRHEHNPGISRSCHEDKALALTVPIPIETLSKSFCFVLKNISLISFSTGSEKTEPSL